jgi:regulator of replication initiation timing
MSELDRVVKKKEPTEREKKMLREKLETIAELQKKRNELLEKKQQIKKETQPLKRKLHDEMIEGPKRLQYEQCLVERVSKKQQRRPTLTMTYEAIKRVKNR